MRYHSLECIPLPRKVGAERVLGGGRKEGGERREEGGGGRKGGGGGRRKKKGREKIKEKK